MDTGTPAHRNGTNPDRMDEGPTPPPELSTYQREELMKEHMKKVIHNNPKH